MKKQGHTALYGNIAIPRGYCSECDGYAFIIDGRLQCCDKRIEMLPEKVLRVSDCPIGRRGPSRKSQKAILEQQDHRCFYCSRRFGQTVWRNSRSIRLVINWDHVNPYVYSLDNRSQNFVAACHVCNGIKSSLLFGGVDEARTHITEKWKDKGYGDLSPVSIKLRPETNIAKVL